MTLVVKRHKSHEGKIILAVCDKQLIGKRFEEGNRQLDLASPFYYGVETTEHQLAIMIQEAYVLHLVGKEAISFAVRLALLHAEQAICIATIPHAEILLRPLGQT